MNSWLIDYCCSQEGLFIIPIEALSPAGIESAFSDQLTQRTGVDSRWLAQFNRAWSVYWKRAKALSARDPGRWLPPRLQHVAIVTEPETIRPYFQPFHQNSWLLYLHDFDPRFSTLEFSTFLFFQAERMGLMGSIVPALHANLPYFLTLSGRERKDFMRGCERTDRPDTGAWRALGKAQSWLKSLFHETFRRPNVVVPGTRIQRENGLIVPPAESDKLAALQKAWGDSARKVLSAYQMHSGSASRYSSDGLAEWLSQKQPQALITGENGSILWDPENPERNDGLKARLATLTKSGNERIRLDLEVIDRHSIRFLGALRDPEALAKPAPYMTEGGLSYIHPTRRLIAYDIGPGRNEDRLWEASPPYERLMLGARTVHEWGHLAAESDWVVIPREKQGEREELVENLATLFDEIAVSASESAQKLTAEYRANQRARHGSLGKGLLAAMLKRIEDYMANLVARQFLSPAEMDTYVRNNVASRVTEYQPDQVYMQLIRLVYEYQYLSLSRIENPTKWFYESTWIKPIFIDRGVLTRPQFAQIVDLVSAICNCYVLDENRFDFPAS